MTSHVQLWLRNPESRNKDAIFFLPYYTAYYSNFFVLRLNVCLNRQPVKLNISLDGQLELCGQLAVSAGLSMDIVTG